MPNVVQRLFFANMFTHAMRSRGQRVPKTQLAFYDKDQSTLGVWVPDEDAAIHFGRTFGNFMGSLISTKKEPAEKKDWIVCAYGDMGAGKTLFVDGAVEALSSKNGIVIGNDRYKRGWLRSGGYIHQIDYGMEKSNIDTESAYYAIVRNPEGRDAFDLMLKPNRLELLGDSSAMQLVFCEHAPRQSLESADFLYCVARQPFSSGNRAFFGNLGQIFRRSPILGDEAGIRHIEAFSDVVANFPKPPHGHSGKIFRLARLICLSSVPSVRQAFTVFAESQKQQLLSAAAV